jgi:hypothetical protein
VSIHAASGLAGRVALLVTFVVTLPLVTPRLRGADEIEYFAYMHSIAFDHDLEFGNEYQYFYDRDPDGLRLFKETFLDKREARSGYHFNFGPIGSALLWSPFYLLAHAGVLLARAGGASIPADGLARPYEAAACYGSALYGLAGLLLIHHALRRFAATKEPAATLSVLTLWLGTPVVSYMTVAPGFSHACSLFAVALLLCLWLRAREEQALAAGRWLLVGAAGGLAGMVREQDVFFLVVPVLDILWRSLREQKLLRGLIQLGTMAATAGLAFLPQLLVYRTLTGGFRPSQKVEQKMHFTSPFFLEVLFDPAHGLFAWSPVLLVAVVALFVDWLRRRDARLAWLLAAFLAQAWISGSVASWTQAGAFGSRRFIGTTFIFAFGMAALLSALAATKRRWLALAFVGVAVWWNLSLMVQFGLKLMDRQGLEWPRVAVNQFTAVPPRLAHAGVLFFTDRERLVREIREAR